MVADPLFSCAVSSESCLEYFLLLIPYQVSRVSLPHNPILLVSSGIPPSALSNFSSGHLGTMPAGFIHILPISTCVVVEEGVNHPVVMTSCRSISPARRILKGDKDGDPMGLMQKMSVVAN
jgi:hypothetical protein